MEGKGEDGGEGEGWNGRGNGREGHMARKEVRVGGRYRWGGESGRGGLGETDG